MLMLFDVVLHLICIFLFILFKINSDYNHFAVSSLYVLFQNEKMEPNT